MNDVELRKALMEQYHAGLAMLAECVENCPGSMWLAGEHPRTFWRIVFHAAFFTHLYMGQGEEDFQPWPGRKEGAHHRLWSSPSDLEPYELPEETESYRRGEMYDYIRFVDGLVDTTIEQLDLDSHETGFSWYRDMSKLSHQLLNLRHLQGHVGQLSELLMARGIEIDWVSKSGGMGR